MTPLGHTAISYCLGKAGKNTKLIIPAIIIGVIPDIDFIFIGFDWFNDYHRVVTHNVFFIILVALLLQRIIGLSFRQMLFLVLVGFVHLFVDSIMDSNPTNGIGVSYFYPISKTSFSPFNLFSNFQSNTSWNQPIEMLKRSFALIVWEIPFVILALILLINEKRHRSDKL